MVRARLCDSFVQQASVEHCCVAGQCPWGVSRHSPTLLELTVLGGAVLLGGCSVGEAEVSLTLRMMGELVERLQAKRRACAKALGRRQQPRYTEPKGGNEASPGGGGGGNQSLPGGRGSM